MSRLRVEFLVEPFNEGEPGLHVQAAVGEFEARGLVVEIGPFGNTADGPADNILDALRAGLEAAVAAGASRVNVNLTHG
ncbi:MAG: hypothetical protein HKN03_17220 [Acidimicrobiales bacterium]|nr:thiamine-binding protein [Acidimicrobiia bacterium]MBT8250051.1 thiamine-binding protein [Acidimicrobiia bacterium]NNC42482.1 hypothetical protein [Acidimicrobiia bacterium]NNF56172.1 hypothetical protein [Acidimicrobiales bacterium]NNL28216.1 hypothetical protein [Acidimicrobiia bacterium]